MAATPESAKMSEITAPPSVSPGIQPEVAARPKLQATGLNFFYGSFHALHNISLEVPEKRITALIGPSGCGKSTFLRTLNRINETVKNSRYEGHVLLDGQNVLELDVTKLRRRVGMVFQRPNPFPKSIYENIAYGVKVNGLKAGRSLNDIVEHNLGIHRQRTRDAQAASVRLWALWRPAAAAVHRACAGGGSRGFAAGRTLFRARPHRHF